MGPDLFAQGGLADLTKVHSWVTDFLKDTPQTQRFEALAERIEEALNFMKACGITPENARPLAETELYTSHEALLGMKRHLLGVTPLPSSMDGMQHRRICCGSVTEPASTMVHMLNICAVYQTRLV